MLSNCTYGPTAPTRLSLMGIRFAELGGTGEGAGGTGGEGTGGEGGTGGTQTGEQTATGKEGEQGAGAPNVADLQATIARLEREKTDARVAKEGQLKQEAKRTELLNLSKVLGVEGVEDNMSIETLTEKITGKTLAAPKDDANEAALRTATLGRDVATEAWKQGIPADKAGYLNYSLSQRDGYKALNPAEADYGTKLAAEVKAVVDGDPSIFAAQTQQGQTGGGSSGGGGHQGTGGGQTVSQETFDAMTIAEKTKLFETNRPLFDKLVTG